MLERGWVEIDLELIESDDRWDADQFAKFAEETNLTAGREIAETIVERLRNMLKPGGSQDVGASGKASENFEIRQGKRFKGSTFNAIEEGTKTDANMLIRTGLKPGHWTSLAKIKTWADMRGIKLVHPSTLNPQNELNKELLGLAGTESVTRQNRSGSKTTYARSKRGKKNVINAALSAIRYAIKVAGTERKAEEGRKGANWMTKYPSGEGRFQYFAYLFMFNRNRLEENVADASTYAIEAYITYLAGGGKLTRDSRRLEIKPYGDG